MTTRAIPLSRQRSLLREVVGLMKLRIGVMIMLTALIGVLVTPGPAPGLLPTLVLALAVLAASASAGAFNQYYEAGQDHLMARTRSRAFVTGALPHTPLWLLPIAALLLLAVLAAAWAANASAALFVFLGAFFYGVVYTVWLKRLHWSNIVIGGLAGSFAVLGGAAAVDPTPGVLPLLFALILFLWTPPHFWSLAIANREDYAAAGVPMLPVVVGPERAARAVLWSAVALALVSLLPAWFGMGSVYLAGAALGSGWFVFRAWQMTRSLSRVSAIRSFLASLVQLGLVLLAACADVALR